MSKTPDLKSYIVPAMLPAAPGTCIIEMSDVGPIRTPVVFWAPDAENPYRAPLPVTVKGVKKGGTHAIEFGEDGMVHDPRAPLAFMAADEWAVWAEKNPDAAPVEEKPSKPAKPAKAAADEDEDGLKIEWATKPFKQNSFYRYDDGELDFIFQVEGGLNPPKQKGHVSKIKRDEFMALKKEMDVADYDELVEGRAPGMDDIGSYDDDDDLVGGEEPEIDDDDLI